MRFEHSLIGMGKASRLVLIVSIQSQPPRRSQPITISNAPEERHAVAATAIDGRWVECECGRTWTPEGWGRHYEQR